MSNSEIQSPALQEPRHIRSERFATTQWSIVRAAGGIAGDAESALEELCRTYWYPLYAYARRRGYQICDAQDLTQGFIASLIQRNTFDRADPDRGRFRSFLLGSFNRYLSDEHRRQGAQKRRGDRSVLSIDIDAVSAEHRYRLEPGESVIPEAIFERRWALTVLDAARERLKTEYTQSGNLDLFEALREHLGADRATTPNRQISIDLGMEEGAVKTAAHRLRKRYRAALRAEIAQTVTTPEDLEAELQQLFLALGNC